LFVDLSAAGVQPLSCAMAADKDAVLRSLEELGHKIDLGFANASESHGILGASMCEISAVFEKHRETTCNSFSELQETLGSLKQCILDQDRKIEAIKEQMMQLQLASGNQKGACSEVKQDQISAGAEEKEEKKEEELSVSQEVRPTVATGTQSEGVPSTIGTQSEGVASTIGPFKFLVNRGKNNFEAAFINLNSANLRSSINPGCVSDTLFTYFDTYGGKQLPNLPAYARTVLLLDRALTNHFDNKSDFARRLQSAKCEEPFAATYFSAEEALRATDDCTDALFFVKSSYGTAGKGMRVVTREELRVDGAIPQRHVAQRAVEDLSLIDGRKFVVRFFILIHNKELLAHRRGTVIIHGEFYERSSTDYKVQIGHEGSGVRCASLDSFPDGEAWHRAITRSVSGVVPALQPLIDASSLDRYAILGLDAVITSTGEAKLIEVNVYPNLWNYDEPINEQVKQPLLRDVIDRILRGAMPSGLDIIAKAAT